jgi:endonuclease/exonuclease/phosphatase (EEP) superfamily protein YafD
MPAHDSHSEAAPENPTPKSTESHKNSFAESWLVPAVQIAGLGALIPFLLSYFSPWLMVAELAVNFQVQWFAGMFFSGLALLLLRRWWSAVFLLGAATIAASAILPIYFSPPGLPVAGAQERLRIMSFNVLGSNRSHAEVVAEIRRHDPDVLIIVEYTISWEKAFAEIKADYPHMLEQPRWHGFGIAMFSKLPLRDGGIVANMPLANDLPVVRAIVDFSGKPLEILGAHLINPIGEERRKLRAEQFAALTEELSKAPAERVLLGDFNCADWSSEFRGFVRKTGLRDSRQGFGILPSWSPQGLEILSIPIDHALVSKGLAVLNRTTGKKAGSDHCPVIIDLTWNAENKPESP